MVAGGAAQERRGSHTSDAPKVIGDRYRVEERLGEGAMGDVYAVMDTATSSRCALKRLRLERAKQSSRHELLFRREFHTVARLHHPNVVSVREYGIDESGPYYTMELLDGGDFLSRAKAPVVEACRLLRDAASALAFLHCRRLLHRDLGPRNVRCGQDGRAKLIDFGLLATVGTRGEPVGTPPCIPPEALRGLPLTHRSDLFGFGALAYWLLTGRHAYPAARTDALESVWQSPPPPPSTLAPNIPQALDDLVMSLLSLDPLGRPSSAAEVIDRLGAIGQLERLPEAETVRGYLRSASLVGRHGELGRVRRRLEGMMSGKGCPVLIEGPSGMGKTRLLRELSLEAQLVGATVVHADAGSIARGPHAVLGAVANRLLDTLPDDAVAASTSHAAVLARAMPELKERLRVSVVAPEPGDPRESRAEFHAAFVAWMIDLSKRKAIAILIDDLQRCDEGSAACIAALAHASTEHRFVIGASVRTDEAANAPAALAAIRDGATRLRLRGLDAEEIEDLVREIFGDVENAKRLGSFLGDIVGGTPLQCIELARHLVDQGVIRYVDGIWVIPDQLNSSQAPRGLAEAMDVRIRALSPSAREVGQVLSIYGGDLPLELCIAIAGDESDIEKVFAALDELVSEDVLQTAEHTYRFRHDGLREALLRSLDDEKRRRLHLRVGNVLVRSREVAAADEATIGWHLLQGGEASRGANFLERAGRRLFDSLSFSDAIHPLEAALEIYEREGRSLAQCLSLRFMLLRAGFFCDRKLALRQAEPTLDALAQHSGMKATEAWMPFVGRHAAFVIGLGWAWLRWLATPPSRKGPSPVQALRELVIGLTYMCGVASMCFDHELLAGLVQRLTPLAAFENHPSLYGTPRFCRNLLAFMEGRLQEVCGTARHFLAGIEDNSRSASLDKIERRMATGAARFHMAMIAARECDPGCDRDLEALEKVGLRIWDMGSLQVRIARHLIRGEQDTALELQRKAELLSVQLGSAWQMRAWVPAVASLAYAFTRDVIGLKRTIAQLAELQEEGLGFDFHLAIARGEYLRERGEYEEARATLEKVVATMPDAVGLIRPAALCALAETLLAMGEHARAVTISKEAFELSSRPALLQKTYRLRAGRALALAEAALGNLEGAGKRLDQLIDEAAGLSSPVVSGAMHEGRARVALMAGNEGHFRHHCFKVERFYNPTRNPVLIARYQRLLEAGTTRPVAKPQADYDHAVDAVTSVTPLELSPIGYRSVLGHVHGTAKRAERSLHLMIETTRAEAGWLFLPRDGELQLAAPAYGDEPPQGVRNIVERAAKLVRDGRALVELDLPADEESAKWQPFVLSIHRSDETVLVGVAVLMRGELALWRPNPVMVESIAQSLYEAGDVDSGRPPVPTTTVDA